MSGERGRKKSGLSKATILRMGKRAIASAEDKGKGKDDVGKREFALKFLDKFGSGPEWCRETLNCYLEYLRKDLLGTLKKMAQRIESPRDE
jgi:hypothetical protein